MKPESIIHQWIEAVNKSDVESLLALYNEAAIVTPTFSSRILDTPEKIRDYFEKLTLHEELGNSLHEKTIKVQPIGNSLYVLHGIYNFRFKVDGEVLNFEARFTYVVDMKSPSPIIHHHSSHVPRMI